MVGIELADHVVLDGELDEQKLDLVPGGCESLVILN